MPYIEALEIRTVAIVGCGSIGASWAALFIAQGLTVTAFDINPASKVFLYNLIESSLTTLSSLGLLKNPSAKPEDIIFTTSLEEAVKNADLVQENGPERLDFKQKLFTEIAGLVRDDVIIATSSSGLTCSSIQEGMPTSARPERCVVAHPFNPPHLIPLVEVVGGSHTSTSTVDRTLAFYNSVGKKAVHVKKEVVGHIANRLQAALFREIAYLVQEDVASVKDIDDAMSHGPGLRWGLMGPSLLMHLAGGEGGVRHMADHLLGPLMSWYAPVDPVMNETLKDKWVSGTLEAVGDRAYTALTQQRDEELVRLINVRKSWDNAAEKDIQGLVFLDTGLETFPDARGSIKSCNTNGSGLRTIVDDIKTLPDGITVDRKQGYMYWTNMGRTFDDDNGSIERADLDGSNRQVIVHSSTPGVHTPKQICIAEKSKKLYWCDREGMKVCRSNLDGTDIEILRDNASTDAEMPKQCRWCVGIAVDETRGWFYWSQKGPSKGKLGRIFRAKISNPSERECVFDYLPEPIDLEVDEKTGTLYWTDRGDPPKGNTLNRAVIDGSESKRVKEVIASRLHEAIGLALNSERRKCYVSDLSGGVYEVDLDTKEKKVIFAEAGDLTGIALA
jgi:3-hydroxyacyl-CoA dehydrogenase